MDIPPFDISGQQRMFVFLGVLISASYLLLHGDLTAIIYRDLILGSLGAALADSAHDRYVNRK
jgi:hypothetical protein